MSMPIFCATGSRGKTFFYSFLFGIAEPIEAIIGYLILMPFISENLIAYLLAFIAGIMIYISLDELLPMAHRYGHEHTVIAGIISGMIVMAFGLLLL